MTRRSVLSDLTKSVLSRTNPPPADSSSRTCTNAPGAPPSTFRTRMPRASNARTRASSESRSSLVAFASGAGAPLDADASVAPNATDNSTRQRSFTSIASLRRRSAGDHPAHRAFHHGHLEADAAPAVHRHDGDPI